MRTIQVSTPVFAAIWAAHRAGEDAEDAILARLLGVPVANIETEQPVPNARSKLLGFRDDRFDFRVDEGFEIFRRFKGREYRAKANEGMWLFENDGKRYLTLAELSRVIGAGSENSWDGWLCHSNEGSAVPIGSLRNPRTVQKRSSTRKVVDLW